MSEQQVSKTVIDCEPTIDIKIVAELYGHLKTALEQCHEVEINVADVQRVDAAVLQVFLAFVLEAQAKDMNVTWQGVSDAFQTAANLLGVGSRLGLPEAA